MPSMTLLFDLMRPAVFVTGECSYLSLVSDRGPEVTITKVVLAEPDNTPTEKVVSLRPFLADLGVDRMQELMRRFYNEGLRQLRAPESLELEAIGELAAAADLAYLRKKLFAALKIQESDLKPGSATLVEQQYTLLDEAVRKYRLAHGC